MNMRSIPWVNASLAALMVIGLGGCAAGVPNMAIDEGVRAQTHTVWINSVTMPASIDFFGQSQSVAALAAGPLAALMDDKLSAEPKARLTRELQDNHIDVSAMLKASFAKRVIAEASMRVIDSGPADAQIDLVVNRYGFAIARPGTATLYPLFGVSAIMKDAKGQVVWQGSDLMTAHHADNKEGHPLEDLLGNPEMLQRALATGGDLVSEMLVRNLMGLEAAQNVPGIQK